MKKTKIVVIGLGNAGSMLVDTISKNDSNDIEYISFAQKNVNDKFLNNDKVKIINTSRGIIISLEKAKEYCIKYNKTKRLEELLSLIKEGDEIYEVNLLSESSIQTIDCREIKLKRNDKTIDKFKL